MNSFHCILKCAVSGIRVFTLGVILVSGAMAQMPKHKPSPDNERFGTPILDPLGDVLKEPGRSASTKKLFKISTFTDGTIRGYLSTGSTITGKSVSVYANGRMTKYASITLPSTNSNTASVNFTLYTYYSNGLLKETLAPNSGRSTYTYNDSGKVSAVLSTYISPSGEVPQSRSTYTYIDGIILTQTLYESYANSVWGNSARYTYYTDSTGVVDSTLYESWQSGWVSISKTVYSRDRINHSTTAYSYYKNYTTGQLELSSRTISIADTLGHVTQSEIDTYSASSGTWMPSMQQTASYDSEGFLQLRITSFWNTYSTSWQQYSRYECTKYSSPSVTLIAPNEGENHTPNSPIHIQWLASGLGSVDLGYSTNNGSSWNQIAANVPDTGYFVQNWTAPASEYPQCKIKVSASGNSSVQHILEGTFSTFNILTRVDHATNTVRMSVLNNGYLGADAQGNGSGFRYKSSANALFSAGVFIGTSTGQGKGMLGSFSIADFQNSQPLRPLTSNAKFDQVGSTTIQEIYNTYSSEIGIRSQSRMSDDFVFVSYILRNRGYAAWSDMYVGMFADWDVGNPFSNFGGIDSARGLAYQYESGQSLADSNYYGIIALSGLAGATIMTEGATSNNFVTTIQSIRRPTLVGDNRMFIGSGPFAISPGDSAIVDFAFVAGTNLADLQTHADSAKKLWKTKAVSVQRGFRSPLEFSLHQNYPNPFNPSTRIDFEIPTRSRTRIDVMNLLGQRVTTLLDEERSPGLGSVQWTAAVPSGVYFYRIDAIPVDNTTKRFVQVRKMIVLK